MIAFVAVLLCIYTTIVISMWLCIGGQITNMYKRVDDIKRVVDLADITVGNYYIWLKEYIGTVNDHLTTEIACLATKNNEDIKRMGGKFEEWDLIELDGNDLLITDIDTDGGGNVQVHCINNKGKSVTYYRDAPAFKNAAHFVKHSVSPFEERQA